MENVTPHIRTYRKRDSATGVGCTIIFQIDDGNGSESIPTVSVVVHRRNEVPIYLLGTAGDDIIDGKAGDDSLYGGAGVDRADYVFTTSGVTADLANASANTCEAVRDVLFPLKVSWDPPDAETLRVDWASNEFWGFGNDSFTTKSARTFFISGPPKQANAIPQHSLFP
ncbi:hypothetical protein [Cognatiyoonia sp. IB215182]|uniref:hypothetical protein n=1 Tax=Cognatiyoonia sp. IB215182 TaxID=3097353 RepID=UPI002A17E857|nr:hypothetical protein [Cognatiyoonia sp. IB215182]MDX8354718.1 hypothetical protein [Cognatiyoonia sp. IB215182]